MREEPKQCLTMSLEDGSSRRDPPERCPSPADSQDFPEKKQEDPQHCSGEDSGTDDPGDDDEVLDPTWVLDNETLDEEAVVTKPQVDSSECGRCSGQPIATMLPATAHHSDQLGKRRVYQRISKAWHFFTQCDEDRTRVICTLCSQSVKRGQSINNLSTSCMTRHLQTKHELQWMRHQKNLETPEASPSASVVLTSTTSSPVTRSAVSPKREDVMAPLPPPLSSQSTPSQGRVQLSIPPKMEEKVKFGRSPPQTLVLNGCILKFLAFEMLPFRLVETDSFKDLMAAAVPQYVIPSCHYFSQQAILALHQQVVDKIRCALRNAISPEVHLTIDTWTSGDGQGRYISLTAHWVNAVAAGSEAGSASVHTLPPPRIVRDHSLPPVDDCSTSFSPVSSSSKRSTSPTTFSTALGKRQQAVLKLICLDEIPHAAQELWTGIQEQTDEWLLPLNLKPRKVVCDNGRNIVAAMGLAKLMHIPCLAHVLSLVVQRFLANYTGLPELLHKVRAMGSHFRLSHPAAARLSALQRNFGLPTHCLLHDVPTKWNSTLHMLERVCEQQQAIIEYQLQNASGSQSSDHQHFTTNDWASMRDICAVLHSFQYATNIVSAEDAIISDTIPILCLLEKTLHAMTEVVMVAKEGAEKEELSVKSTHDSQVSGTPLPSQETILEEEEEFSSQQGGTQPTSWVSLERGWGDMEEEETPLTEDCSSLPLGSLAHMSHFMLQCLRNDPRVARIVSSADYWVATLLDPRYKDKITSLIAPLKYERKMREYKCTLVEALLAKFPSSTETLVTAQEGGGSQQPSRSTSINSGGRISMAAMWDTIFNSPQTPPPLDTAHNTRRQTVTYMTEEYLSTRPLVQNNGSFPFNFWVSKLDTWPELALYALEVLACPAASAVSVSEREFSTAGGFITDKRIRQSTANVDILTFIKMNQAWIPGDLEVPAPQ
ncbi:zinc finger BED domain-containing protein 6-like [Engystomops pustulosus]|uniref:zinc finger BED domain-containing protein 6-like n=1 Tax=Engystomops pustulosus TaxID=76066 RepID=UPI003AFAA43F